MLSSIYHSTAQHSTAQHSTAQRIQPCTKQRRTYAPIRLRQRKQADRVGESQRVVEHLFAARCVTKSNEEIEICPAQNKNCNRKQMVVTRERFAFY